MKISLEAEYFEEILRQAIRSGNPDIQKFCKLHIVPLYKIAATRGGKVDTELLKIFNAIED